MLSNAQSLGAFANYIRHEYHFTSYIINFLHTIPISAVPIKNAPDIYNTWHWHGGSYPGDSNGIKKSHFDVLHIKGTMSFSGMSWKMLKLLT